MELCNHQLHSDDYRKAVAKALIVTRYAIAKRAPVRGYRKAEAMVGWGWIGDGGSTRGDVSSFRLPAMGLDVFMGCLLGQASLHTANDNFW